MSQKSTKQCHAVLCGAGASGTGLLIAAINHGFLDVLAEQGGIVAYEKSENTGGMLANTRIPSNSFASVFVECLPGLKRYFGANCPQIQELEAAKEVTAITSIGHDALELTIVGSYLKKLGSLIWDRASQVSKCELNLEHEIVALQLLGGDAGIEVTARSKHGAIITTCRSKKVIISMGGVQNLDVIETIPIYNTVTMALCRNKLIPSHTVVQRPGAVTQMLLDNLSKLSHTDATVAATDVAATDATDVTVDGGKEQAQEATNSNEKQQMMNATTNATTNALTAKNPVVIVGGSHSAWAAAFNFLNKISRDVELEEGSIVILHRSPIRMYYGSLEEAETAGYKVDPIKDVCPLTGRVNRYGGLRYHVNTLAQSVVLAESEKRIKCVHMGAQADQTAIEQLFNDAVLVVAAIGYAARVPTIVDAHGATVKLQSTFGQLTTNAKGQCSNQDGVLLPNVLAYGLGAGQFSNPEVGGEASFAGRVDGVWLYSKCFLFEKVLCRLCRLCRLCQLCRLCRLCRLC
jgi:hypothetical protein